MVQKIKLAIGAAGLLLSVSTWAGVAIDLRSASPGEVVELVVGGILKRDYALGPGVASSDAKITIRVGSIEKEAVESLVTEVLGSHGFEVLPGAVIRVNLRNKAAPIGPLNAVLDSGPVPIAASSAAIGPGIVAPGANPFDLDTDEIEVYHPKFRSVAALSGAVKLLGLRVPDGAPGALALLYRGRPERVELARALLAKLDKRVGALDVRAVILEYSDTSESQRSFSAVASLLGGRFGFHLAAGVQAANSVKWAGASIQAVLSALDGDSRFQQLAEPRLRVVDGTKARVLVGADFPVRGPTTIDKLGNAVAGIEYKQAGVILELSPTILEESITLGVRQQVSSVALTTSSGIDSPSVNKREVETVVEMKDGELVMLAGLDNATEVDTSSGFAWLPDVLRGTNKGRARSQVLLLLEAHRVSDARTVSQ